MKANIQCFFTIPDRFTHIAMNRFGVLNGFYNPPIRDFDRGEWQDSVDGSYGELIVFDGWDHSVRKVSELTDVTNWNPGKAGREKRKKCL
jgi:hypothetical protein